MSTYLGRGRQTVHGPLQQSRPTPTQGPAELAPTRRKTLASLRPALLRLNG